MYGNFIFFGQRFASLAFQQQRLAGFERQHGDARAAQVSSVCAPMQGMSNRMS